MATYTYQIRTSKDAEQIKRLIRDLPAYLSGRRNDLFGISRTFQLQFTASMFKSIHNAFMLKSTGHTDELGERWKGLAESTIEQKLAKIRRHGPKQKKAAKKLTPTQTRIYEQVYASNVAKLTRTKGEKLAKQTARRLAAKAVVDVSRKLTGLGSSTAVPILIDTARLESSLRPGRLTATSYSTSTRDQLLVVRPGHLELGTKVPYTEYLMNGTAKMPARRLWPSIRKMKPWTDRAASEASQSVVRILKGVF